MCDFRTSCSVLCDTVYVHTFISNSIVFSMYLVHQAIDTLTAQATVKRDTSYMVVKDAVI